MFTAREQSRAVTSLAAETSKSLNIWSPDAFFRVGARACSNNLLPAWWDRGQDQIGVLHLVNSQHLLAWSLAPSLPGDKVVIVGGGRVATHLAALFSPRRVQVVDSHITPDVLSLHIDELANDRWIPTSQVPLRLNHSEFAFMWGFMSGRRWHISKNESALKRRLMKKLGARSDVALLARFRLVNFLPAEFLACDVRIQVNRARQSLPNLTGDMVTAGVNQHNIALSGGARRKRSNR